MALYKRAADIASSTSEAFDVLHGPGATVPNSGIYRCTGCGREVASNAGTPFPPQNHHQHAPSQGQVSWRLAVYAQGDPH